MNKILKKGAPVLMAAAALFLQGCGKDKQVIDPAHSHGGWNAPTATSDISLLRKELEPAAEKKSFYAGTIYWTGIELSSGMQLLIPGNGWKDENGNAVSGNVDVEILQNTKAGMNIRNGMPTQTDNQLLVTGGSYQIRFSQNGKELSNAGIYYMSLPLSNKADWKLFSAEAGTNWNLINDPGAGISASPRNDQGVWTDSNSRIGSDTMYKIPCKYRRINCDIFYNDNREKSPYRVSLPADFNTSNTDVYCIFKKESIVVKIEGDADEKLFRTGTWFPGFPTGAELKIVAISKIGSKYYLGTKDDTVVKDAKVSVAMSEVSKAAMQAAIDGL